MNSRGVVDALLFDLGGVLIEVDFDRVFEAWARAGRVPVARIAARFAFDQHYEAHERGAIELDEYCVHLRSALGLALADEELLAGWNCIFGAPVPGMQALLEQLARLHPLYIFSNTNRTHVAHWQPRYRALLAPISAVYCSCDLGVRKPDVEAFLTVAKRIGVEPQRIAFFDDHAVNVAGARSAGLLAKEVHSAAEVREALAQFGVHLDEAG